MRKTIIKALIAGAALGILIVGLLYYYISALPQVGKLEYYEPIIGTKVYDRNGTLIKEYTVEKRRVVSLNKIPKNMVNAIISIEDNNFYHHFGIDIKRILGAAIADIKAGHLVEGGSTLTQQLARGLFLNYKKTISRKIREALLALEIEKRYSKDEIIQMYLNQINFGKGNYGIQSAAKSYFGKNVEDLSLPECALLAGIPKSPTHYNPVANSRKALRRRNLVLRRMVDLGYITELEYVEAVSTPLLLAKKDTAPLIGAYFLEYVRRFIENKYGYNALYKSGLNVYTTLDYSLQKKAEELYNAHLRFLENVIRKEDAVQEKGGRDSSRSDTAPHILQGALVAVSSKTGEVVSMIGGRDFNESQFNRAVQAQRQPGSAIKPIIYTAAIQGGFTALDRIYDGPVLYQTADSFWTPENYEKKFFGWNTLKTALAHSRNVSTIKLFEKVGVKPVETLLNKMSVAHSTPLNLTFALGTISISPLKLATVYSIFPNNGIMITPKFIRKITDRNGTLIYDAPTEEKIILSPQVSFIMTKLLQNVVNHGTGQRIRWMGLRTPVAGKTGTTDSYRDAWFIGFSPDVTTAVWVGYDDMTPIGKKMTGSRAAIPLWTRFMKTALKTHAHTKFTVPDDIVWRKYDPDTLKESDTAPETPFIKGTFPKKIYLYHK